MQETPAFIWVIVRLREGLPGNLLQGRATFSGAVSEAQKAVPPIELRLEPATRTVVAGGERFELPPWWFALYWMMAERRKSSLGGVHWSDPGLDVELLGYYGRLVGENSGLFEQAEGRNFGEDRFEQYKARINRGIERALGERWAPPYKIYQIERIAGTRRHRFGLSLPPEAITIDAASLSTKHGSAEKAHIEPYEAATRRKTR
jgi:hypothetical protein